MSKSISVILIFLIGSVTAGTESYRLLGTDGRIESQSPTSASYNCRGMKVITSTIGIDFGYGWYLNKENDNSLLLMKIAYSKSGFKSEIDSKEEERIKADIPYYIYTVPDIHTLELFLFFEYHIQNSWYYLAELTPNLSSDLADVHIKDINSSLTMMLQKRYSSFHFSGGGVVTRMGSTISPLPLVGITYFGRRIQTELILPVSIKGDYTITEEITLSGKAELITSSFYALYSDTTFDTLPDQVTDNGLELSVGFDHNFYQTLHWALILGYNYRERRYLRDGDTIEKMTFQDGLFLIVSLYSSF